MPNAAPGGPAAGVNLETAARIGKGIGSGDFHRFGHARQPHPGVRTRGSGTPTVMTALHAGGVCRPGIALPTHRLDRLPHAGAGHARFRIDPVSDAIWAEV